MNFKLDRILVPVDFSDDSLIAAKQASALARRLQSEVTLLHVNEFLTLHALSGPLGFGITSTEAEQSAHMLKRQQDLDRFALPNGAAFP